MVRKCCCLSKNLLFLLGGQNEFMQTLTLEITHINARKALRALEEKHFIKVIEEPLPDSPAHAGKVMPLKAFKNWINAAESSPTVSLNNAKSSWLSKRKELQRLIK